MSGDSGDEALHVSDDLVPIRKQLSPGRLTTTTLDGTLTKQPLKIVEDLTSGCGGQLWPAGMALAKYCIGRFKDGGLHDKHVVELGSGGGVTGLAIALELDGLGEGNSEFWMTDMEAMVPLMKQNVALNGLQDRVKVGLLDWADPIPEFISHKPVDIILAADCVYFEPAFPLLEQTLINLAGDKTEVLFCYKKRRRADMRFIKSIRKKFVMTEIEDEHTSIYKRENIYMYTMTKKLS